MPVNPPRGAAVIGQAGGPTVVINQSLVGVIEGLRHGGLSGPILGARCGVRGMVQGDLLDLSQLSQDKLNAIALAPSAALGSTRDKPDAAYCERIFEHLRRRDVRYFFYIGGNDSSDTCRIVNQLAVGAGYELRCLHVPKTIDNDLVENDHTPGYPSAARFVGKAFMGDNLDNASLKGIKINIVMGRHAGFLTAASALARRREDDAPHLIYLPERDFDPERFVGDVDRVYTGLGRCVVAVSEGIHTAAGEPISTLMSGLNECDAHGNVQLSGSGALGDWLANLLRMKLTPAGGACPRIRADTFGYLQRCYPDASPVDQYEARTVGRKAAEVALLGDLDGSISIKRMSSQPYECRYELVELAAVAGKTRRMPAEFIGGDDNVSHAFLEYLRPLVGELPIIERL